MKRIISMMFVICLLFYGNSFANDSDQNSGINQLRSASKALVALGLLVGTFATVYKFERTLLPPNEKNIREVERNYNEVNYVLMSTGASCFVIGSIILTYVKPHEKKWNVSLYKPNDGIGFAATIRF